MVVMCLNDIWFSKQLWRNNCNKIWLNRNICFWHDFIRCHASGFFWWFQFQLIQSLICWFHLGLPQNWSRTHLAIIEKNSKRRHPTYQIIQTMRWVKTPSLNERPEKALRNSARKKPLRKSAREKALRKSARKKPLWKNARKKPLRKSARKEPPQKRPREKPLRKSARINLFKVTDTLELPLGSNMRRKRKPDLDIS